MKWDKIITLIVFFEWNGQWQREKYVDYSTNDDGIKDRISGKRLYLVCCAQFFKPLRILQVDNFILKIKEEETGLLNKLSQNFIDYFIYKIINMYYKHQLKAYA